MQQTLRCGNSVGRYSSTPPYPGSFEGLCGEPVNWNSLTLEYTRACVIWMPCCRVSGLTEWGNLLTVDRGFGEPLVKTHRAPGENSPLSTRQNGVPVSRPVGWLRREIMPWFSLHAKGWKKCNPLLPPAVSFGINYWNKFTLVLVDLCQMPWGIWGLWNVCLYRSVPADLLCARINCWIPWVLALF